MQSNTTASHPTRLEAMTDGERLAWVKQVAGDYRLSLLDVARYTGYSYSTVAGWFTSPDSARYRPIPLRAAERLELELKAGNVRGSK